MILEEMTREEEEKKAEEEEIKKKKEKEEEDLRKKKEEEEEKRQNPEPLQNVKESDKEMVNLSYLSACTNVTQMLSNLGAHFIDRKKD